MIVKKETNRAIVFLILLAMIFSGFGNWGVQNAYAGEDSPNKNVTLSFQSGGFILPKQEATVSSGLAETYGYSDSVPSASAVSTLDVLVKVHEISMGITGEPTSEDISTINAMFKLSFISAIADEYDSPLIMPWLEINVINSDDNIPLDIPTNDVPATVTITDANATYVTKQALDIGWFDIRPFMASGDAEYTLSNKILTANALIEAVYYNLYGNDPSRQDLQISADSTTAQAIKAQLNIYNSSWGLSTGSIFGNDKLVMSAINSNFGDYGIGGDQVSKDDDIVFYSYDREYAYFDLLNVSSDTQNYSGVTYPIIKVKLRVAQKVYPDTVTEVSGAGIYLPGNTYCYGTTGSNGIASAEFWGAGISSGTTSGAFLITAEAEGVIRPYVRIEYTMKDGVVTITRISQAVLPDTSLSAFSVNAYGKAMDVSNYASNNLTYDVDNNIENLTLSAITNDNNAVIGQVGVSSLSTSNYNLPQATGGSVTIPLDLGFNNITFTVTNGIAQATYNFTVKRSTESANNITATNRVIVGIAEYSGYAESVYDYNWIIGKKGAGKTISEAEKKAFLTQVVNGAGSLNVGSKAKTAIALSALNIDATKVPVKNSDTILDLVSEVYSYSGDSIPYISYVPYMLMLEDLGIYDIPAEAKWDRARLIQYILDNYTISSGWNATNSIDNAAMMIPALAPYYKHAGDTAGYNGISQTSCSAIKAKVDQTVQTFKTLQQVNGSFANNANSTAVVIAALASLGIDADGSEFTKEESAKSALKAIFAYETAEHRMGFTDTEYSEFASKDALMALASYLKYYANGAKNGDGCVYRFSAAVSPYTSWPNADLLTSIKITPPTRSEYSFDVNQKNYAVDTTGMGVKGMLNGDASKTIDIPINECTVSAIDCSKTGTQTVTVSYKGYTATFMIKVSDGTVTKEDMVSVLIKSNKKTVASSGSVVIQKGKTTAMDVLKTVLDEANKNYIIKNNVYVSEIDGLGEFDEGANSGWLYSVNGVAPETTAAKYKLEPGDSVVWYYTLDYTKDPSSSKWMEPEVVVETNDSSAVAVTEVTAKVDATGKAIAQVSGDDITKAITKVTEALKTAKEGVKAEVQIKVQADTSAKVIQTVIPRGSMTDLKNKVDHITLITPCGDISFSTEAMTTIAKEASGDVTITVSKNTAASVEGLSEEVRSQLKDIPVFELSVSSGGKLISNFGGKVEVSLPYVASSNEEAKAIIVYYINEDKQIEVVRNCNYDADRKVVRFTTIHFSKYAVGYKPVAFTDISKHWANENITYLAARDVIKGLTETNFAPNSNITRAQVVQIFANMSGEDLSKYNKQSLSQFNDVNGGAWYTSAVQWAVEKGVISGMPNKNGTMSFNPNDNISRQDLAVILSRYVEKTEGTGLNSVNKKVIFADDNKISPYAKDAIVQLQQAGVISGKSSGEFKPEVSATRAECSKIISVLMQRLQ